MTKRKQTSHLDAALAYLEHGWAVIPAAERAKRPIIRWQAYQAGPPSKAQIYGWFKLWPKANLSVVTGKVSGIVVLDVDPGHGGAASLAAIEDRHGPLPETVEAKTGGGGRHIYFAYPDREVRNRAGLAPGLDLRGDGGVIIVPPSVHPSGKRYRWRPRHGPDEIALAPMPIWLLESRFGGDERAGHPVAYWRALAQSPVAQGKRNATIASFTGHLLWHEVDPDVILELMLAWNRTRCTPPIEDDEVIRTVRSIEHTHRGRQGR
ncbi:MAG: bifunctional DNA primase/polymerase [Hyphomicrobiales bacterium]